MQIKYRLLLIVITTSLLLFNTCRAADLETEPASAAAKGNAPKNIKRHGLRAFSIHDTDQDGLLSRQEYRHFVEKRESRRIATGRPQRYSQPLSFDEIDSSNDGYINEDELIAVLNIRLQKHRRYRYRGNQW